MTQRSTRSLSSVSFIALTAIAGCGSGDGGEGGGEGGILTSDAGQDGDTGGAVGTSDAGGEGPTEAGTDAAADVTAERDAGIAACKGQLGAHEECRSGLHAPAFKLTPIGFYMDSTEVTRSQYQEWLATRPATTSQLAECQSNDSFEPDAACMTDPLVCTTACDAQPQVCVDWCDAAAYCRALGKQLCGARPDALDQGPVGFADFANPEKDQFQYVCSADGKLTHVYGDAYDAASCNTGCTGSGCATIAVGSNVGCQGADNSVAFPGIFDLNGNVAEWDGLCNGMVAASLCHVRGGDMASTAATSRCDTNATAARNAHAPAVGFRCCSGP